MNLGNSNFLVEVPLSVSRFSGRDIPVGGGGYLRYFPYWWTRKAIKGIVSERPAIVYLHPYELDKEKYPAFFYKALASSPLKKQVQLRFYRYKKSTVESKLDRLTKEFACAPMFEVIQHTEKQGIKEIDLVDRNIINNTLEGN